MTILNTIAKARKIINLAYKKIHTKIPSTWKIAYVRTLPKKRDSTKKGVGQHHCNVTIPKLFTLCVLHKYILLHSHSHNIRDTELCFKSTSGIPQRKLRTSIIS